MQSGKKPPISACEHLEEILNTSGHMFFHTNAAYLRDLLQLQRAKAACKLGMVVDPRSSAGTLFLSREQYDKLEDKKHTADFKS